ncbi:helix-turn-helix transcriptional regulator [Atopobium fossor]|uniref:helix-turn-helix transcriptional regulator n=1 Tax=Atopobium fossor TaxID=39487 RepID=UPI00047FB552|nr:LuxR C-terminal-related transcriptional regulator [Atopobium fossor]
MSLFFFVYTIALLFICIATASICGAAWAVSHRNRYIPQALFFIFYFAELASIFGSEWMVQNISNINPSNYYDIDLPAFRILIGAAILSCFWYVVLDIVDVHRLRAVVIPAVIFIVVCTGIVVVMPYGPFRQWLFYTMRQISLIFCLVYARYRYQKSDDEIMHQRITKRTRMMVILSILIAGILIEDTLVILNLPIPGQDSIFAALFLSSRNFSENIMMLYLTYTVARPALEILSLHFNEPPEAKTDEGEAHRLNEHIEDRLPAYAAAHGLSKREREILGLAMQGKNNREIASELILAEGTIKTHLHNIMKKCEQANREDLRKDFWAS